MLGCVSFPATPLATAGAVFILLLAICPPDRSLGFVPYPVVTSSSAGHRSGMSTSALRSLRHGEPRKDAWEVVVPRSTWREKLNPSVRGGIDSSSRGSRTALSASSGGNGRSGFSWDEEVLGKNVKDMLVDRATQTLRHLWSETGGGLYGQWLDKFFAKQNLGDDVIPVMGWGRFLLKMMREEPFEAVVVRTAKKDSKEVVEAQRKSNARPPTLSPWRHTANELAADWDAEEEEEFKVALDHPPQLKAVSKNILVQPADIAKRIMDIREQLAAEWGEDLANIETENEEIHRLSDLIRSGDEEAVRAARRLTYDHQGGAFGGNSSPYRAENYAALVDFVTEIGALAVQEKMRVAEDSMGWNWMEQFLYWSKTNSVSGYVAADSAPSPPISPASAASENGPGGGKGQGGIGEGKGARGKTVDSTFGAARGGMDDSQEEKMRGNVLVESMMMGQKVQMFDDTGELVGVDPAEICKSVMAARLGVAERIRASIGTVPDDHGLVLRKYLQDSWESSSSLAGEEDG